MASLTTASKKRANFPLPRELRDQIYQYLLHSDYTRVERKWKSTLADKSNGIFERQGYYFHTNILGVNRAIHDEAREYLYKNNIFVVASADWFHADGDSFFTVNTYTPVVTETKAARMKHHSLRLHVAKGNGELVLRQNRDPSKDSIKIPTQSIVLLLKDLDALLTTLRTHVSQRLAFTLMIEDNDTPSRPRFELVGMIAGENKVPKPTRFKVQFLDTPWRKQDADTQRNTLASLRDFHCASMRVTIDGVLPEHAHYAELVKDTMGTSLLSPMANDWNRVDTYTKGKKLADDAMCAGKLELAEIAYKILDEDIGRYIEAAHRMSRTDFSTTTPLNVLRLDVFLTLYYLQVKLGRMTKSDMATQRLTDTSEHFKGCRTGKKTLDPDLMDLIVGLEGACRHLLLLKELFWDDSRRLVPRLTVGHLVKSFSICEDLPYNSYDLATLRKVPNQKAPAWIHLSKEDCSVSRLPPQLFNFHEKPAVPKKPNFLVGMMNMAALRTLDDATKMQINFVQRQCGQKVTNWG